MIKYLEDLKKTFAKIADSELKARAEILILNVAQHDSYAGNLEEGIKILKQLFIDYFNESSPYSEHEIGDIKLLLAKWIIKQEFFLRSGQCEEAPGTTISRYFN